MLWIEKYIEVAATFVFGAALFAMSIRNKFKSHDKRWRKAFLGNEKIDSLLSDFIHDDNDVDMVTFIVAENGGGIPHPGSKIKTSIVSEAFTNELESYKDHWQNVSVDSYYMTLLRECSIAGFFLVEDSKQLKDSMVKDSALSLGIDSFRLEYVTSTKKAWFYLVLSSKVGQLTDDPKTKDEIRVLKQELISIIHK